MNCLFLANSELFRGIREQEIYDVLSCLCAYEKNFNKDEIIFREGNVINEIGLVESGCVNEIVNSYWGNSSIFAHIEQGRVFAETYSAVPGKELPYDVVAAQNSQILFLNMNKLLTVCHSACSFHQRLIRNLLKISAQESINLSSRMLHIAQKSIRGRLLSYFSEQSAKNGSTTFLIPFSRQQLADYLNVDRSALSNELSKMKKDGLIDYHKNSFKLNNSAKIYE